MSRRDGSTANLDPLPCGRQITRPRGLEGVRAHDGARVFIHERARIIVVDTEHPSTRIDRLVAGGATQFAAMTIDGLGPDYTRYAEEMSAGWSPWHCVVEFPDEGRWYLVQVDPAR